MKGKVFKDSVSVYEDQAHVLFDYYRQVAQKIVEEEIALEQKIASKVEEISQLGKILKVDLRNTIIIAVVGLILVVPAWFVGLPILIFAPLFYFFKKKKGTTKKAEFEVNIQTFKEAHASIKRDYKVHKLGVVYVPIATAVPFEGKSFLVDHAGLVSPSSFVLRAVKKPEELKKSVTKILSTLEKIPVIDGGDSPEQIDVSDYSKSIQNITYLDYMGTLDREMRSAAYHMGSTDDVNVTIPVVDPNGPVAQFIHEHCTSETGNAPILKVYDTLSSHEEVERFNHLNSMRSDLGEQAEQFDQFLQGLMVRMGEGVQLLTQLKMSSCNILSEISNKTLINTLKASFNHYSPVLEAEEIERIKLEGFDFQDSIESYKPFALKKSSRTRYDLISQNWVSDDGSRTSFPFGMHQIYEEVVIPVVKNLMDETRKDRLLVYNSIKDQKLNYLNQWHQDTEDFYGRNRAESNDLINRMRSTFANYTSAFNTLKALESTEKAMSETGSIDSTTVTSESNIGESLAAFEAQGAQFQLKQQEFNDYMDRLKDDIDRRAAKFSHIEYYDASLIDGLSKENAVAGDNLENIDLRRRSLAAVNPYFARTAIIPPLPQFEPSAQDDYYLNLNTVVATALKDLKEQATTSNGSSPKNNDAVEDSSVKNTEVTPIQEKTDEKVAPDENQEIDNSINEADNHDSDAVPEFIDGFTSITITQVDVAGEKFFTIDTGTFTMEDIDIDNILELVESLDFVYSGENLIDDVTNMVDGSSLAFQVDEENYDILRDGLESLNSDDDSEEERQ